MTKKRTGGLPYLRTSVKFDFDSMGELDDEARDSFKGDLKEQLLPLVDSFDLTKPGTSKGHELQNCHVSIGLQPVFNLLATSRAEFVLLDAILTRASAVSNIIALYVKNSGATAYSVDGLAELLSTLNIKADALASTAAPSQLNYFLKTSSLRPISLYSGSKLHSPSVSLSQGKNSRKKSRP